jgi:hypothetical protein
VILSLILTACSPDEEGEDLAAHACEHAGEAGDTIAAAADTMNAPELPMDGEPHTVTLVPGAAGFVSVAVDGDTAALLFAGTPDVVTGLYEGDEEQTLGEEAPNEDCPDDIPAHFDLDFHDAGTWYVEVGPAAVADVWLLLIEGTHEHEE